MSLSRSEIRIMIYQALLDMAEGGIDRVRAKYAEALSEVDGRGKSSLNRTKAKVVENEPLSDGVVTAVIKADRFIDARTVLDLVRENAIIQAEPDERYKRRKVSLALYGQKDKALVSIKADDGRYVWGLPEWWNEGARRFEIDREPIDDDGVPHAPKDIDDAPE